MRHSQPLQFQKTDRNGINNIDLQLIDRHQSTSLCRTNQELRLPAYGVSQKNNDIGQAYFFLPSPSPLSFFHPCTYRKGYYFYSPQSSTVIKSKMAATTILRTRTRFRPPKIRLHCRLLFKQTHKVTFHIVTSLGVVFSLSTLISKLSRAKIIGSFELQVSL